MGFGVERQAPPKAVWVFLGAFGGLVFFGGIWGRVSGVSWDFKGYIYTRRVYGV